MNDAERKKLNDSTTRYLKATKYLVWVPLIVVAATCLSMFYMLGSK